MTTESAYLPVANRRLLQALTDDEKRTLLVLLVEDIRGWFDVATCDRTPAVIDLATDLGYDEVRRHALAYADQDDYPNGLHFLLSWRPAFPVTRLRSEASAALIDAVETLCMTPEYRLEGPSARGEQS
jgi:hypothetical protein